MIIFELENMDLMIKKSTDEIPKASVCTKHSIFSLIALAKPVKEIKSVSIQDFDKNDFEIISLNGQWKRKADFGELSNNPSQKLYDDFNWNDIFVPNNYGLEGELQRHYGPVWYRKKFQLTAKHFVEIHFGAVDYLSEVWLNGKKLGDHEGYFGPFYFDITKLLEDYNVLAVKVVDPCENLDPSGDWVTHRKKYIKGTMNYHDSRPGGLPGKMSPKWSSVWGQSLTTGGITQPVYLKYTGNVSIFNIFVTPLDLKGKIHITLILENKSEDNLESILNFHIETQNSEIYEAAIQIELVAGSNRLDLELEIPNPQLWSPSSAEYMGRANLYRLRVQAIHDFHLSDELSVNFGIRNVSLQHNPWKFQVNDQFVFIKAVNYIPRQHFAEVDETFYLNDMHLIKECNLNSVGVHAHVQCKDCYTATDKEGILVFQDFALQWAYDSSNTTNPEFRDKACKQITEMVYFLYNHPSVVYWCCHNEPPALFTNPSRDEVEDFDNQVLDELLEATVKQIDTSRPVHRASGLGEDLHVYDGSLMGGSIYSARKRKSGFVSEYGFWSIAESSVKWGDVGWPPSEEELIQWSSRCSFFGSTSTFIGHPKYHTSRKDWIIASLLYGAFLAKFHTEIFRSQKCNPYNAIRWHFFVDWWGYAGGGLLDVDRTPKLPYYWYKEACRPLLLIADLQTTIYPPNSELEIPIIAVNDFAKSMEIKWNYELLQVSGSRVIAGDPNAALLGGTGAPSVSRHKIAIPVEEPDVLGVIIQGGGTAVIPPNSTSKLDTLTFTTPNTIKNPSYLIQLKWTVDNHLELNWAHFMVGNLKSKINPGLHIFQ